MFNWGKNKILKKSEKILMTGDNSAGSKLNMHEDVWMWTQNILH